MQGVSLLWSTGAHTHTHTHKHVWTHLGWFLCHWSNWMKQILINRHSRKQSAIMGEGLTKHNSEKIHGIQKLCLFTSSLWERQVCVRTTTAALSNPDSVFAQRLSGCSPAPFSSHVCSCFLTSTETKEISRGEMKRLRLCQPPRSPSRFQDFLSSRLPAAISSFLTLFNHTQTPLHTVPRLKGVALLN